MKLKARFRQFFLEKPLPVMMVPGEYFFLYSVPLASVQSKAINSLVALALEEVSPFPLEQLYWGFCGIQTDLSNKFACVYAVPRERLRQKMVDWEKETLHVLPSFFAGIPQVAFEEKTIRFIREGNTFSALIFEKGDRIPHAVKSIDVASSHEGQIVDFCEDYKKKYAFKNYQVEWGYWHVIKNITAPSGDVIFYLKWIDFESQKKEMTLKVAFSDKDLLWTADIRHENFKKIEIRKRLIDRLLGYGFFGAIGVFSILFIWNFILMIFSVVLQYRESGLEQNRPIVDVALEHQRLLDHINHIYDYCLAPFSMLDILNHIRPKGLYFTQINIQDATRAELKGVGSSVDQVNEYGVVLNQSEAILNADIVDVQTRQGKVQFVMSLVFEPLIKKNPVEGADPEAVLPPEGSLPFDNTSNQTAVDHQAASVLENDLKSVVNEATKTDISFNKAVVEAPSPLQKP